ITTRTGIKSRHVISDERLEDLGAEASMKALEMAGLSVKDIDLFIVSNVVSEHITPGMSCVVAEKIGLNSPMFDINCACPGFIYAIDMAEAYYKAGKVKNVLIACIEEPSRMPSWQDRSTCVLFGDGAGAVVLTAGDNIKGTKLKAQPDTDKLFMRRTLESTPYITKTEVSVPLQMRGREVFRFAVEACTNGVKSLLDEVGIKKEDVSWFMVHQANKRIIDSIIDFMQVPSDRFPVNIQDHGNSSSASCPILLDECNRKGMFKKGDIIVLSAFGAGLLSGAAVVEW
ncbi:MAG: beta-ketoacyl-ACP synthase 3, partial [Bacteroidales bacterium]|nr:beta-ketoacyl-ACP synthase 3 [Bacteroidales bacterium]